jgi:hypothetical protein
MPSESYLIAVDPDVVTPAAGTANNLDGACGFESFH